MPLVDLSHTIRDGLVTYPGLPAPRISDHLSRAASRERYAAGTEFHIAKIELVANTGTYLDAPSHRWADGADLSGVALEKLAELPALVVDLPPGARAITARDLPSGVRGCAVLLRTGWSAHFGTPRYFEPHPHLSADGAEALVSGDAALVGIDSLNIDDIAGGERPVHSLLLRAGIPIVEHLTNLAALPASGFRFFALPPKIAGMGTFPVRAFAALP
ncbi:MAG: cyclase family protein [Deltaproteobacteria bacterium]|nr:cyclase family protein [Deltaproteobacteria bacterium]